MCDKLRIIISGKYGWFNAGWFCGETPALLDLVLLRYFDEWFEKSLQLFSIKIGKFCIECGIVFSDESDTWRTLFTEP